MEEQLEMEESGKLQGMPAEGRNRKETRRFSLQLGSMIAQWMVLLACVICISLCYLKSPDPQPQWVYVKLNLTTKYVNITKKEGTMNVLNRSIQIRCDGHYLFFLEGTIYLQPSASLRLEIKKRVDLQETNLLDVLFSAQKAVVQQVLVSMLRAQDEIILEKNQSVSHRDLSLVLIMLTPHSYCSPEKS